MTYSIAESPFTLFGNGKRVAVALGDHNIFVMDDPCIVDVAASLDSPHIEVFCADERMFMPGPTSWSLKLGLRSTAMSQYDRVPKELLAADDLTVRQLFAAIDRKLGKRAG